MIRDRLRALRPDIAIALAYLILPLLLYAGVTIGPRTMLPADNLFQWPPWREAAAEFDATIPHNALIGDLIIQNYAWKRFVLTSLKGGEIPLWNPYLFAGALFWPMANTLRSTRSACCFSLFHWPRPMLVCVESGMAGGHQHVSVQPNPRSAARKRGAGGLCLSRRAVPDHQRGRLPNDRRGRGLAAASVRLY